MKRKLILTFAVCVLAAAGLYAETEKTPQLIYIERYSALAVEEMQRSGVPASITLAQGLLESRYGLSELAMYGNNHFGIKCHNWAGRKLYHDDDRKSECFRSYESPEESFRDHSDFLRFRDRYKFLFNLDPTDYKGWAHGLKKAGYATDPAYPQKLIKLIEDYSLYRFDLEAQTDEIVAEAEPVVEKKLTRAERKAQRKQRLEPQVPQKYVPSDGREVFRFPLSRQLYSLNGVPYVIAAEGETYSSIAKSYGLFLREILKYNDLDLEPVLDAGTVVYLQAKKKQAPAGMNMHVVEGSESIWELSQKYAVKVSHLCKMNSMLEDHVLREGEVVKLRK